MRDKIIGLLALTALVIGAIAYALFVEGAGGSFLDFTSIPFLVVIAFGGLPYMKKDFFRWLDGIHNWLDIIACSGPRRFKK